MKRIIQGLAFAALVLAAPAVWSESLNLGDADAGSSIPVQSTYADRHATDRARVASSASTQAALSE